MFAASTGWNFVDSLYATSYNYDDERFIGTMQWFQDQIANGNMASYEDMASLGASAAFAAGETVLTTDGSWMIGFYSTIEDMEVGFARLPEGPEGRKSMFNGVSILTGTGYASDNYGRWGDFPVTLFFMIGLIGGCAGSTTCSIKVFRYQILLSAIRTQARALHSPHGIFSARYDGEPISQEVFSSVMAFLVMFIASLVFFSLAMALTGEDLVTSVSGAASALANIGPGLGQKIGPDGNFQTITNVGKWILCCAMVIGRLELLSVFVLFSPTFWRR